jgi:adenine-specific DNA-methyltransferase
MMVEMLDKISEEMAPGESLLIACKAFQEGCENRFAHITIKKIPSLLLDRCEFGRDDYSFHIVNMPEEENAAMQQQPELPEASEEVPSYTAQPTLFD